MGELVCNHSRRRIAEGAHTALNIERWKAAALVAHEFTTLEEVAYVPTKELFEVEGIGQDELLLLREKARNHLLD